MRRSEGKDHAELTARCLAAFIGAGSLDLSLDNLAARVGLSKRMLIHYFGSRENLEIKAIALLEDRLRHQFRPDRFAGGASLGDVIEAIWKQSTAAESRGVLLVIMGTARRAWSGAPSGQAFYAVQQKLWADLLLSFLPDPGAVEELLQLFQGAVLAFLVTGDPEPGRRALARLASRYR